MYNENIVSVCSTITNLNESFSVSKEETNILCNSYKEFISEACAILRESISWLKIESSNSCDELIEDISAACDAFIIAIESVCDAFKAAISASCSEIKF